MSFINTARSIITGSQNGGKGVVIINGQNITASTHGYALPPAAALKVIAVDEHGDALESFSLPTGTALTLSVRADRIGKLRTQSSRVVIEQCADIDSVSTASGSVRIERCGNIDSVKSMSGAIKVDACARVGRAKSMSGGVRIVERGRSRSRSPKR